MGQPKRKGNNFKACSEIQKTTTKQFTWDKMWFLCEIFQDQSKEGRS